MVRVVELLQSFRARPLLTNFWSFATYGGRVQAAGFAPDQSVGLALTPVDRFVGKFLRRTLPGLHASPGLSNSQLKVAFSAFNKLKASNPSLRPTACTSKTMRDGGNTALDRLLRLIKMHPREAERVLGALKAGHSAAVASETSDNKNSSMLIAPYTSPVIVVDVLGAMNRLPGSQSIQNDSEAFTVTEILSQALAKKAGSSSGNASQPSSGAGGSSASNASESNLLPADVAVVTPYSLQQSRIQELVTRRFGQATCNDMRIGTVELLQGSEAPLVVVSCVRSVRGLGNKQATTKPTGKRHLRPVNQTHQSLIDAIMPLSGENVEYVNGNFSMDTTQMANCQWGRWRQCIVKWDLPAELSVLLRFQSPLQARCK